MRSQTDPSPLSTVAVRQLHEVNAGCCRLSRGSVTRPREYEVRFARRVGHGVGELSEELPNTGPGESLGLEVGFEQRTAVALDHPDAQRSVDAGVESNLRPTQPTQLESARVKGFVQVVEVDAVAVDRGQRVTDAEPADEVEQSQPRVTQGVDDRRACGRRERLEATVGGWDRGHVRGGMSEGAHSSVVDAITSIGQDTSQRDSTVVTVRRKNQVQGCQCEAERR